MSIAKQAGRALRPAKVGEGGGGGRKQWLFKKMSCTARKRALRTSLRFCCAQDYSAVRRSPAGLAEAAAAEKKNEQGLHYVSDGNRNVIAFGDASYGSEWDYRSRSGGLATLAGGVIASYSEKQRVPSTSTNEAETRCLSTIINVSKSIHNFLREIPVHESNKLLEGLAAEPPTIYIDNSATVLGANTNIFSRRQRHLEVKLAHINHEVAEGNVKVFHIRDAENSADINTKPKSMGTFKEKRDAIRNSTFVHGLKTVDTIQISLCQTIQFFGYWHCNREI
eukprot:g38650.t1